jgi:hypothetical protein
MNEMHRCLWSRDLLVIDILEHVRSLDIWFLVRPLVKTRFYSIPFVEDFRDGSTTEDCQK